MINIPTIVQLYNSFISAVETQLSITIPTIGKNVFRALSSVHAGSMKLYYLAIANLQKNIFPDTADPEATGGTLERFGRVKLGRNPYPAQSGQYTVSVVGSAGGVIAAQTTFKSDDTSLNPGILYILDNAYTLTGSSDLITIRSLTAGLDGKLNISDTLTATIPIANVNSSVTVTAEIVQPLAAEDIETYRANVLASYRSEPQGGAATDYRLWASEVQGVAETYPYAKSGANNEINLFIEALPEDSTDGKGTPTTLIINNVEQAVEFSPDTTLPLLQRGRRPLGVFQVHYLPVTIKTVDISIASYAGLTTDIQNKILSEVTSQINKIRPFVAAADIASDKNDILNSNKIVAMIISAVPGSIFGAVTMKINGSTVSSFQFLNGDIPYLNSISYT